MYTLWLSVPKDATVFSKHFPFNGQCAPKDFHTIYNPSVRAKNSIRGKTYLGRVGAIWPISPLSTLLRKGQKLSNGTLSKAQRKQLGWDKGFQKSRSYLQLCAGARSDRTLGVELEAMPRRVQLSTLQSLQKLSPLNALKSHLKRHLVFMEA